MCLVDAFATILLSVPGNTVDYDDVVILSGHAPSLGWPLVSSPRRSVIRRLIVLLLVIASVLAAWDEGIASCSASMHNAEAAAEVLGLPEGHVVANVIALGYPAEERDPVLGQRPRMEFEDFVHQDRWES